MQSVTVVGPDLDAFVAFLTDAGRVLVSVVLALGARGSGVVLRAIASAVSPATMSMAVPMLPVAPLVAVSMILLDLSGTNATRVIRNARRSDPIMTMVVPGIVVIGKAIVNVCPAVARELRQVDPDELVAMVGALLLIVRVLVMIPFMPVTFLIPSILVPSMPVATFIGAMLTYRGVQQLGERRPPRLVLPPALPGPGEDRVDEHVRSSRHAEPASSPDGPPRAAQKDNSNGQDAPAATGFSHVLRISFATNILPVIVLSMSMY
ncbi:Amino acid transporter [Plasmodiophora brassicae]|uniref:Uncharacterized protein n=1 Tax=Plasmodiophora brassicae TaxID=37360 RepID=A0A0G4IVV6_PLABS|nr:hypothetical protein PBRA_001165 [Plasmodiophora brassicae]